MNKSDPKWTAYVLGELSEQEKNSLEHELKNSAEAMSFVNELKETSAHLRKAMKNESAPTLSELEKKRLYRRSAQKTNSKFTPRKMVWPIAASALVGFIGLISWQMTSSMKALQPYQAQLAPKSVAKAKRYMAEGGKASMADTLSQLSLGDTATLGRKSVTRNRLRIVQPTLPTSNTEAYDHIVENEFIAVKDHPLSTLSTDVDTASYANVRRFLMNGTLPPKDAVRIEEMINYFSYEYPQPKGKDPVAISLEGAQAPWNKKHKLVRVGLKARSIPAGERKISNLVFLLDVSGSMDEPLKLPLVKKALKMLVENLGENDRIAMVVYAGASGLVLPSTPANQREKILDAIDQLNAGGSTNGGEGIQLAYQIAQKNFVRNGSNRVILATDGDFNVGITNEGDLVRLIEGKAKEGVFLTVLGFGSGNYKDATLEKLADKGNGNYAYIDTEKEARKALVEEIGSTLVTVAKDVKVQVEFNPARVQAYRLIGYENRLLAKEDFNNDQKDAGDLGAGHTTTVLYEIIPAGEKISGSVDPLKYQPAAKTQAEVSPNASPELLTVKVRYKQPEETFSQLLEEPFVLTDREFVKASNDFRFATAVTMFGMILRDSKFKGDSSYTQVIEIAEPKNFFGKQNEYKREFIDLVKKAQSLPNR